MAHRFAFGGIGELHADAGRAIALRAGRRHPHHLAGDRQAVLYLEQGEQQEDLEDRLVLSLLNEAVSCLHDGVVADADLLDAGVIFGTGFAPFRGGPIAYIRSVGADALVARLLALQAKYGARFAPRPGWDSPALR